MVSVTTEIGQHHQVLTYGRCKQFGDARADQGMSLWAKYAALGVPVQDVVEQRPGGGLPGLVQPQPGQHRTEIRTPYAGDTALLR